MFFLFFSRGEEANGGLVKKMGSSQKTGTPEMGNFTFGGVHSIWTNY